MKRIMYIPLDERPCNYNFINFMLEENVDIELLTPPLTILGRKKTPANYEKLKEFIKCGMAYEDICINIMEYLKKTGLLFMLKSLKTFANNGRVSPIVAKVVGIAGICIVGKASAEGTLEPMHKCRGEVRSLKTITEELENHGFDSGVVMIGHCENEDAANRLKDMILAKFSNATVKIHKLRGLCSFYAEKGGVLVGYEKF